MAKRRSKLDPTLEESFATGKIVGAKEALAEILEIVDNAESVSTLRIYLNARLKTLNTASVNDPFKQKDSK